MRRQACIIGGGVIGGGWAARFLLNGWDVNIYDPDPEAERKIAEVLTNARTAYPCLFDAPLPEEGRLRFCAELAEALQNALWIQESIPERLELKQQIYAKIQAVCETGAIIGSSTSGFTPTDLQIRAAKAGQILVTHPYNPVYLLPLVELVASPATSADTIQTAREILASIGMKAVHIAGEIDAHVGDRLLEAVWREALWLVKDGIATTQTIDDIITHSFGLRWAQMGLFETYRIAGGEAGMHHFLGQFGPALKWPWTKLMDVPELDDALIDKIASQSDAQSGRYSFRELEQIRDRNLIGFLNNLKSYRWGAGAFLADCEAKLAQENQLPPPTALSDTPELILTHKAQVLPSWLDYNGHMTEFRYLQVCSEATDKFLILAGIDDSYIATGVSYYTVETHLRHLAEAKLDDKIEVSTRLHAHDLKKLHLVHEMKRDDGIVLATAEHMLIHVDREKNKACPAEQSVLGRLDRLQKAHDKIPAPEYIGRHIG